MTKDQQIVIKTVQSSYPKMVKIKGFVRNFNQYMKFLIKVFFQYIALTAIVIRLLKTVDYSDISLHKF